jgi:hypothetical protein
MNFHQSSLRWLAVLLLSLLWATMGSAAALAERGNFRQSSLAAKTPASSLWSKADFNGTRVYQRNDLIDAALVDARGRTNLQRMQGGLAPIGPDGKSLNLHHTIQTADGPLAEMTATFHQQNSKVIHINPNTIPSGIDRRAFDVFRRDYWINRANDF